METASYINITGNFINSLRRYIINKGISLDEVAEVFAGNGRLGLMLGLKPNSNISDLFMHQDKWYIDEISSSWEFKPTGVKKETAEETIIRFKKNNKRLRLLIAGAPPPANSYYCPSYDMAKALHYLFDAEMIFIGAINSEAFASSKFFNHVEKIEDPLFNVVTGNYVEEGYFKEKGIKVEPHLLRFVFCKEEGCDCKRNFFELPATYRPYGN